MKYCKCIVLSIFLLFPVSLQAKDISLGTFKVSHYCSCIKCCNKTDGITASGKKVKEGMIVNNWMPFGTKLKINGKVYTVEDRGAKSHFGSKTNPKKRIDIYCKTHKEALEKGIQYYQVILTFKN